jgi:transcriptional regulator with XRE-family HTH domain
MATKSPNPTDIYVGSRVKMQRLMTGLTQDKVATQLGITFQQLQKYEKGTNRIGASRLQAIARVLGVPVGFFFEQDDAKPVTLAGVDQPREVDLISSYLATREGLALNRAFMKIKNPKTRRSILELAKAMANVGDGGMVDFSDDQISSDAYLN